MNALRIKMLINAMPDGATKEQFKNDLINNEFAKGYNRMICPNCKTEVKRVRMPKTRSSVTHKVKIGDSSYYIRVGLIDGKPMEVFINEGKAHNAMFDQWSRAVSLLLQYGMTTRELVSKFAWTKFEPCGMTDNQDIRTAHSVPDYICRWIDGKWGIK